MSTSGAWQFWIDRGGTFTDVVAKKPDGGLITHKLLSENPGRYKDAAMAGIRAILGLSANEPLPESVATIKMGTTVATNALLERKGERTLLVTTKGFKDALRIAYQNRPKIFARRIELPELLHSEVIEVAERVTAQGEVLIPLDEGSARSEMSRAFAAGFRSVAILLMHGYRFSAAQCLRLQPRHHVFAELDGLADALSRQSGGAQTGNRPLPAYDPGGRRDKARYESRPDGHRDRDRL